MLEVFLGIKNNKKSLIFFFFNKISTFKRYLLKFYKQKVILMPKTKIQYSNQIKFNASTQFVDYIRQAIISNEAKDKFGKYPTQTEFIRGVIYQWIRKQTPHILIDDLNGEVPEIIEHKKLKRNEIQKYFSDE